MLTLLVRFTLELNDEEDCGRWNIKLERKESNLLLLFIIVPFYFQFFFSCNLDGGKIEEIECVP